MSDVPTTDAPFDPSLIRDPPPQPLFSVRRLVIVALLVGGFAFLLYSCHGAPDSGGGTGCSNAAVAAWDPCPGSRILRQAQVGVELRPGYDGRIAINGIQIPEDQMEGAIVPGTDAYSQLTPDERALGPRPNNKNLVKFQPGKGKAIETFNGQLSISITYWLEKDGPSAADSISYTVFTL